MLVLLSRSISVHHNIDENKKQYLYMYIEILIVSDYCIDYVIETFLY